MNFIKLLPESRCFGGPSWFKSSNFGLVVGMALKFYSIVIKELKLKIREFGGIITTFREVAGAKLVERGSFGPLFAPTLNRVKHVIFQLARRKYVVFHLEYL